MKIGQIIDIVKKEGLQHVPFINVLKHVEDVDGFLSFIGFLQCWESWYEGRHHFYLIDHLNSDLQKFLMDVLSGKVEAEFTYDAILWLSLHGRNWIHISEERWV